MDASRHGGGGRAGALRRQAKRALRLAEGVSDDQATQALRAHAAVLIGQADSLDRLDPSNRMSFSLGTRTSKTTNDPA